MKSPKIYKNLLPEQDFNFLKNYVINLDKNATEFSSQFNRYEFGSTDVLNDFHKKLMPFAKNFFESNTLLPSFNFGSWYFGKASLEKHKDVAPCSYSIDLCVYQKTPWDLYVEGTPYTLQENDALFYYGESQKHWREEFPDPDNNIVCNLFFFYVEPNHWFFTQPKEKHKEIRYKNQKERNE